MTRPKLVGTVDGHRVYDSLAFRGRRIFDYFERQKLNLPDQPWTKRVYLERSPAEFCEIYRVSNQDDNVEYSPTRIIRAGGREVIASTCDIPGNGGGSVAEAYFILSKDGTAIKLPVETLISRAISQTARKLGLKSAFEIRDLHGFSISSLTFSSRLLKDGDAHCCPTGGSIFMKFKFDGDDLRLAAKPLITGMLALR